MKTDNVVAELQKYGIKAQAYKRPPAGKDVFVMTIIPSRAEKEGIVTINQGTAEVEVFGDKKLRQVVISVTEKPRVVTREVGASRTQPKMPSKEEIRETLRANFPITMPDGTRWRTKDEKATKKKKPAGWVGVYSTAWDVTGVVTATVGKTTTNNFLIGMDEAHNFIAPISKKVTSVKEAHKLLRPKMLRRKAVRQGEWFFQPCEKGKRKFIEEQIEKGKRPKATRLGSTTHTALTALTLIEKVKGEKDKKAKNTKTVYARGYITDRRTGHHKALFLKDWHKVIRNKEATMKVAPAQRKAAKRRRASWD